ncbi:MAG: iron ABC transporter permease [Verrucomicrobiota bacterium]
MESSAAESTSAPPPPPFAVEDRRKSILGESLSKRLLLFIGILVAGFIAAPVLVIAASPLQGSDGTWAHLRETVLSRYIINSLGLAVGSALGAGLIGAVCAWLVTLYQFPGRRWFEWLLLLPLAMPTYLIAYTYTDFLDFSGPVQDLFRSWTGLGPREYWFPDIRSLGGAIILFSFVLYPYVYLLCRASFLEQSTSLLDAARTMGKSRRQTFFRVALPLSRPALAAGCALVIMEALADYGAVEYLAVDTFTTGIYRTWFNLGSRVAASQLAAGLLAVILLVVLLERLSRGRRKFFQATKSRQVMPRWTLGKSGKVFAVLACFLPVGIGFLIPVAILIEAAIGAGFFSSLNESLQWAWHSTILAAITSPIALLFALLLSYNTRVCPGVISGASARVASLGYAIPGSVVAVGVLLVLGWTDQSSRAFLPDSFLLSGSIAALIFAYLTRFLTLSVHTVDSGLTRIPKSFDDAGKTLRAGPITLLARIHFPLIRASTLAAVLLVFVEVLKELPATLIIRPFNFDTLAVRIYHLASDERFAETAAPALLIVLFGLAPVIILSRMMTRTRHAPMTAAE